MEATQVKTEEAVQAPGKKEPPKLKVPKKKKKWLKRLIIAVVVLAAIFLIFIRPMMSAGQQFVAGTYLPETAQRQDLRISVSSTGTITPIDSYKVSALVNGEIVEAPFEEGDWVEKGALLYRFDAEDAQNAVQQAQLSVAQAELGYRTAQESVNPYSTASGIVQKLYVSVGDPVAVARSGVEHARTNGYDVVVVDTAGRLGVDAEMMDQAIRIRDAVSPHEILFVLDAMVGQDAVNTSVAFRDGVGFTGVVLSKLDGDARGGAALSVRGVTGAPVLFSSTGEGLTDFERFHADRMASRILDMGDLLTLIEQAERTLDRQEAEDAAAKLAKGTFTLDDFLGQLRQIRKMGSMKKLLGMMPGMGQMREALDNFDEREVDRIEAIVCSMTPAERKDLSILNGSRRSRIAKGSGTTVQAVNELVDRFEQAKKMMEAMASGGMGGLGEGGPMPGMGSLPGMGKHSKARQAPKAKRGKGGKKGRSGNPAKAARQAKEAAAAKQAKIEGGQGTAPAAGSSFGLGGGQGDASGYGIMPQAQPQAQTGAQPSGDDVADAMSALPDDLRRHLGL